MNESIDDLIGFTPPSSSHEDNSIQIEEDEGEDCKNTTTISSDIDEAGLPPLPPPQKTPQEELMDIAKEVIEISFKDQYKEGFATVHIDDHYEVISLASNRFRNLLIKKYYDKTEKFANSESLNAVINVLQAKAQFGNKRFPLSLRVAEHDGDLYYDLTNDVYQSVKISKNGAWQIIDKTPMPLFKRYNQIPQTLPFEGSTEEEDEIEDPLEAFISNLTNIKDKQDKLIVKVALLTWFIPNIPHLILIVHGGKGSAKSMFLTLIKSIIDPAKPSLFTIHDDKSEFIQQLSHNYMAPYDNLKYNPKWLSDEVCKAVTGIGQTKRVLYTVDEDKIFEYKHCLMFNGINIAFTESDVIDRSILIELSEIKPEHRKTEKEILQEFDKLKPKILRYIFDTLAKAIVIKKDIYIKNLPRMADTTIWGEAIARAMEYKENEFLNAYYNNIKFQNAEVIDSNPVAFAIKKLVENTVDSRREETDLSKSKDNIDKPIFIGTPAELLKRLDQIAAENKISTFSRDWPKDQKWLVRRINIIKQNLQQELGIHIEIKRDSKTNTSLIKIEKNVAGNSGEHKITPDLDIMSPENENLSPVLNELSPEENEDLSTKSDNSGDTGHTGDKSVYVMEDTVKEDDDRSDGISKKCNCQDPAGHRIGHNHPFYYCIEHPKVQNIHLESIIHHLLYSTDHKKETTM